MNEFCPFRFIPPIQSAAGALRDQPRGIPMSDFLSPFSLCLSDGAAVSSLGTGWNLAPETAIPMLIGSAFAASSFAKRTTCEKWFLVLSLGTFAVALFSPLCRLAAQLASAHMTQHILLVAVAPALLACAVPCKALANRPCLPAAGFSYAVTIWLWHAPRAYEASVSNRWAHLLMLATLILAATFFWSAVMIAARQKRAAAAGASILLLLTMIHTGALGALLTFAGRPLYPIQSAGAIAIGLSPLEDQQIAGLLMAGPMGFVYLVAAYLCIAGLLRPATPVPLAVTPRA